ncbi:protein kinase [Nonomuraea sp. K274]|uniref:Protein kinase n=1 Tax=Nonomuraea cypriaca TaxID=1187855 RepID=A0A931A382_9ACTN|nr:protein kinase [Nonomuraea cypriaca]MBF8185386.1 protein kinase [Nonomuraea cypriaca]
MDDVWRVGEVVLGLYEVRDVVRSGGMGLVHRVLHRGWNVELAVKTPRPELVATGEGVRDFEAEAATWVGLGEHPHTVNCVYVRRLDGVPRVFAEWLDGGSLAEAVRDGHLYAGGPREALRRILDIAVQTAWGLRHAHRHGIVHQDVKPANVLLAGDGTAKITDFGLARARAAAGEGTVVPQGASVLAGYGGMTPAYCSPEQAEAAAWSEDSGRPRADLTRATDTWSWALTVLEMFAGHPPCRYGQTAAEVFAAFVSAGPSAEGRDASVPVMPDGLVSLMRRCFTWDQAERPKDMGALAAELTEIYAEVIGQPYPRQRPRTAVRLADELSNQALSLLDLGRTGEAESLWRRAAEIDPHNPHVTYNRGLHLWRAGVSTDAQVINDLEGVRTTHPGDWMGDYLLGLVHLERGDTESARNLLRAALRLAPGSPEIVTALDLAESTPQAGPPGVLTGHTDWVTWVAISADGQTGVSAGRDGTIRVWDLVGHHCLRVMTVTDDKYGVNGLVIDAKAGQAIIVEIRGPARIWDLRTGRLVRTLVDQVEDIPDLRAHPVSMTADGRRAVISVSSEWSNGTVRVWDTSTGRCVETVTTGPGGERLANLSAVSGDGRVAVSVNPPNGGAHVWDTRTGKVLRTFEGGYFKAKISADGRTVVAQEELGHKARVQVWDLPDGRERCAVTRPGGAGYQFAVNADGSRAVCVASESLELWDLTTGRCLRTWQQRCKDVAVSADGRFALTGDGAAKVTLIELPSPGPAAPWSYPLSRAATDRLREGEVVSRALDRTGKLMAEGRFATAAEEIRRARTVPGYRRHRVLLDRWQDVASAGRRTTLSDVWLRDIPPILGASAMDYHALPRTLSSDGLRALTTDTDGTIHVWDLGSGRRHRTWQGHTGRIPVCALSADDRIMVSAGEDATVRVWEMESGRCRHVLRGHTGAVNEVVLSADGHLAFSTGEDATIRVWDVETGECLRELKGHTGPVHLLRTSADGRYAVSHGKDGAPRIWDVPAGRCLRVLPEHHRGGWNGALDLSSAGNVLLSGHEDGTVHVWDVDTGRCRQTMPGHEHFVMKVAGSADGRTGISVGIGLTRIWDLGTGRPVGGEAGLFTGAVVVSSDGRFAVNGGFDNLVRIWDLGTGACLRTLEGHSGSIDDVAISGNGRIVTSLDNHGVTHVWELDWEYDFPRSAP